MAAQHHGTHIRMRRAITGEGRRNGGMEHRISGKRPSMSLALFFFFSSTQKRSPHRSGFCYTTFIAQTHHEYMRLRHRVLSFTCYPSAPARQCSLAPPTHRWPRAPRKSRPAHHPPYPSLHKPWLGPSLRGLPWEVFPLTRP